jgi:hypothetical protein
MLAQMYAAVSPDSPEHFNDGEARPRKPANPGLPHRSSDAQDVLAGAVDGLSMNALPHQQRADCSLRPGAHHAQSDEIYRAVIRSAGGNLSTIHLGK